VKLNFALVPAHAKIKNMRLFLTVILLAYGTSCFAQEEELLQDAITKPALSLRCKELLRERGEKVKVQQRLNALLQRNQDLIKKSPRAKDTLHARLKSTEVKIKNELYLTNLNIESMEENIVRSGCPGIAL
jgi:hypothetical protein